MNPAYKYFWVLVCFCTFSLLFTSNASAQEQDTAIYAVKKTKTDTSKTDSIHRKVHHKMSEHDKAALMSAIIPGLGQVAHHDSWWHVPIIYAGFGAFAYFIIDNNNNYQKFRSYYQTRLRTNANPQDSAYDPYNQLNKSATHLLSDDGLLQVREAYRRDRDLSIILTVAWYGANILDAYISSQLRDFDISNNLSMRFEPLNFSLLGNQPVVTCGIKFNLK